MSKPNIIHYYNLLIGRLNLLLDAHKRHYGSPITDNAIINHIHGTNHGLLTAIDIMEEIIKEIEKSQLCFDDKKGRVNIIGYGKSVTLPDVIDKEFKYE